MDPTARGPYPFVPIGQRPPLRWPNGAFVALWVIPNIEVFALDERITPESTHVPSVPEFGVRDYGARVGIWRIMDVLERHGVRATVALNSEVCDVYPEIVKAGVDLDWEYMGHNESNTRRLSGLSPDEETRVVRGVFDRIERQTGRRPAGWLGSGLQETWNTLDNLIDAGAQYVADWVNDDQPVRMTPGGRQIVSLPYSMELNDKPAFERFNRTPEEFEGMIRRQFSVLYREGATSGRVMAIALHPYLTGMPHRIDALDQALGFIMGHPHVWAATGEEIVRSFLEQTADARAAAGTGASR